MIQYVPNLEEWYSVVLYEWLSGALSCSDSSVSLTYGLQSAISIIPYSFQLN